MIAFLSGKMGERELLIRYADHLGNGAVFKRLGFLADTQINGKKLRGRLPVPPDEGLCRLDPAMAASNLVTAWRLWVLPAGKRGPHDRPPGNT